MNEFMWNKLKIVSEELNRLQDFQAECIRNGQSSNEIESQIDELLVQREHLARALRFTVPPKVTGDAQCVGFEADNSGT